MSGKINWQCIISGVQNNFKEQIFSFIYYLKTKNETVIPTKVGIS
jgi:hypothetical protein